MIHHEDAFVATLFEIAQENAELLAKLPPKARRKFVRLAIEGARVAFAIWRESDAIQVYCLKGRDVLGSDASEDTTVILVKNRLDAIGIADDFGDGAPHLAHSMPSAVM